MARPWSARCYGVARQREGSRQNSIGTPLTRPIALYARARRAATGRAACELWGLCARPPAIEIGEGGLVSLTPGSAR
jgi:hypothetical protein